MENQLIKSCHILCGQCGTRFPSPIGIGDTASFESVVTQRIKVRCPNPRCRQIIDCNKENMSYLLADGSGGAVGPAFGDKPSDA